MVLPDVNILVYALRPDLPQHAASRAWLESVINGPRHYGISPLALASTIRVVTRLKVVHEATALEDAVEFCEVPTRQENCRLVEPGVRHWGIFVGLCRDAKASGKLVQDAWWAALAIESDCEWITNDRDFARFPGLRWRTPF